MATRRRVWLPRNPLLALWTPRGTTGTMAPDRGLSPGSAPPAPGQSPPAVPSPGSRTLFLGCWALIPPKTPNRISTASGGARPARPGGTGPAGPPPPPRAPTLDLGVSLLQLEPAGGRVGPGRPGFGVCPPHCPPPQGPTRGQATGLLLGPARPIVTLGQGRATLQAGLLAFSLSHGCKARAGVTAPHSRASQAWTWGLRVSQLLWAHTLLCTRPREGTWLAYPSSKPSLAPGRPPRDRPGLWGNVPEACCQRERALLPGLLGEQGRAPEARAAAGQGRGCGSPEAPPALGTSTAHPTLARLAVPGGALRMGQERCRLSPAQTPAHSGGWEQQGQGLSSSSQNSPGVAGGRGWAADFMPQARGKPQLSAAGRTCWAPEPERSPQPRRERPLGHPPQRPPSLPPPPRRGTGSPPCLSSSGLGPAPPWPG